jgi:hypothetical protein
MSGRLDANAVSDIVHLDNERLEQTDKIAPTALAEGATLI